MARVAPTFSDLIRATTAGIALGSWSRLGDALPRPLMWVANLGVPWLAVAAWCGARSRTRPWAAAYGALSLATAASVHYLSVRLLNGIEGLDLIRWPLWAWVLVGIPLGAISGALGRVAAENGGRRRAGPSALLAACFTAEAGFLLFVGLGGALPLAIPLEIGCAIALMRPAVSDIRRAVFWVPAGVVLTGLGIVGLRYLNLFIDLY